MSKALKEKAAQKDVKVLRFEPNMTEDRRNGFFQELWGKLMKIWGMEPGDDIDDA